MNVAHKIRRHSAPRIDPMGGKGALLGGRESIAGPGKWGRKGKEQASNLKRSASRTATCATVRRNDATPSGGLRAALRRRECAKRISGR